MPNNPVRPKMFHHKGKESISEGLTPKIPMSGEKRKWIISWVIAKRSSAGTGVTEDGAGISPRTGSWPFLTDPQQVRLMQQFIAILIKEHVLLWGVAVRTFHVRSAHLEAPDPVQRYPQSRQYPKPREHLSAVRPQQSSYEPKGQYLLVLSQIIAHTAPSSA